MDGKFVETSVEMGVKFVLDVLNQRFHQRNEDFDSCFVVAHSTVMQTITKCFWTKVLVRRLKKNTSWDHFLHIDELAEGRNELSDHHGVGEQGHSVVWHSDRSTRTRKSIVVQGKIFDYFLLKPRIANMLS